MRVYKGVDEHIIHHLIKLGQLHYFMFHYNGYPDPVIPELSLRRSIATIMEVLGAPHYQEYLKNTFPEEYTNKSMYEGRALPWFAWIHDMWREDCERSETGCVDWQFIRLLRDPNSPPYRERDKKEYSKECGNKCDA